MDILTTVEKDELRAKLRVVFELLKVETEPEVIAYLEKRFCVLGERLMKAQALEF